MKIGVTGASGHIGSNLNKILIARGYDVRVLQHNDRRGFEGLDVEIVKGSLNDTNSLKQFCKDIDVVFHLAAKISIGLNSYELLHEVNCQGTKNLVNECKRAGVKRLIYFSSIHALKHEPVDEAMDENRPLQKEAINPYEKTKALAEEWVLEQAAGDFEIIVLNPTAGIGPNDYRPSLMGQMLIKLYKGKLPVLVPGGYNWVDVRDVATAAANAIEKGRSGERYILSGEWQILKGIADIMSKVCERKIFNIVVPTQIAKFALPFITLWSKVTGNRPLYTKQSLQIINNVNKNVLSDKSRKELDFTSRPLSESIQDTILWFKENNYI
jgi:dihydroflavonol-4-reductase